MKKAAQGQQGQGMYRQQQQYSTTRGTGSQLPASYHQGREICIKYQSGSCSFPNCRRAHVCRHCKQDLPATDCHPAGPVTLNLDSFQHYLACHLDRQWSQSLLWGICKGVDIGFQGERKTVWSGNWKSVVDNRSVISKEPLLMQRNENRDEQMPTLEFIYLLLE